MQQQMEEEISKAFIDGLMKESKEENVYLVQHVLPTVVPALVSLLRTAEKREGQKQQGMDVLELKPIDFVAKYLYRHNPKHKILLMELHERKPVVRYANELGLDEIHSELRNYGIVPTGVESSNVGILQKIFDDEFKQHTKDYELYLRRLSQSEGRKLKESQAREALVTEEEAFKSEPALELWNMKIQRNQTQSDVHLRGVNDVTCSGLMRSLSTNTSLLSLDLSRNNLHDTAAESISNMLKCNRTMIKLDLEDNCIGSIGLKYLSQALSENSGLRTLNLKSNRITREQNSINMSGIRELSSALSMNRTLTALNLSRTGLDSEAGRILGSGVSLNENLVLFQLDENDIGTAAEEIILTQIYDNVQGFHEQETSRKKIERQTKELQVERMKQVRQRQRREEQDEWHEANAQARKQRHEEEMELKAKLVIEAEIKRSQEIEDWEVERKKKNALAEAKKARAALANKKK